MKLTELLKPIFMDTAAELTGVARRLFLAKEVQLAYFYPPFHSKGNTLILCQSHNLKSLHLLA